MNQRPREQPAALLVLQLVVVLASTVFVTLISVPFLVKWTSRESGADLVAAWLATALIVQPVLLWVLSDRLRRRREPYGRRERALVIPTLFMGCVAAVPTFGLLMLPNGIGVLLVAAAAVGIAQIPYLCRRLGWRAPWAHDGE